jgi:CRISPR system Cascade subunit CasB
MNERSIEARISGFIHKLSELEAGDRARLKRNAGHTLAESRGVQVLIFRLLPGGLTRAQEEVYFMVATLFPMAAARTGGNLGVSLRQAQKSSNRKGLDRRLETLLDADNSQLPFRLRQTIHNLQSNRVAVDWACLLADLLQWNHPDRFVQQNWARAYYGTIESSINPSISTN